MKTRNIILLLSFSFLTAVTTLSQVPVIISQSTTIEACEGDSVTLNVSTDKAYDFQWYTALKDGTGFNSFTASLPYRISIFSQDGQLFSEKEISSRENQVIDIAMFGKGIYLIRIQSASASGTGKSVVL
jgi:hypothetical protein